MPSPRSLTGFDRTHGEIVILVFLSAMLLAYIGLELVRAHHLTQLAVAGFLPWGDDGYYVRDLPGQSLTLTTAHSQALVTVAAITAGSAAAMLCTIAAAFDMHLPFRAVSRYTICAFLLLPAAGFIVSVALSPPDRLTIDLQHNALSVTPGNIALNLSHFREFDNYWVDAGRSSHEELGAVTDTGDQLDLFPVYSSLNHKSYWEGLDLTNALQDYISSNGQEFPDS